MTSHCSQKLTETSKIHPIVCTARAMLILQPFPPALLPLLPGSSRTGPPCPPPGEGPSNATGTCTSCSLLPRVLWFLPSAWMRLYHHFSSRTFPDHLADGAHCHGRLLLVQRRSSPSHSQPLLHVARRVPQLCPMAWKRNFLSWPTGPTQHLPRPSTC